MNIKQIRYFVSVYQNGSLSAAAKEQYVTVQAVSKAIADLERELKSELFVRESRGVHPTPFGKSFYVKAHSVLHDFGELEAFARNRHAEGASALRLGLCTPPFHGHEHARASIATFVEKNMGIGTSVKLETRSRGIEALQEDRLDALITMGAYEHPDLNCRIIGNVMPGVVMSRTHRLARYAMVGLSDIRAYPVAAAKTFEGFNESVVEEYRARGVDVRFRANSAEDFEAFLTNESGLGLVVAIPSLGAMHPGTEMRPIAPEDAIAVPLCLISPKSGESPACLVLEHWLANERVSAGVDPLKRFVAVTAASAHARR